MIEGLKYHFIYVIINLVNNKGYVEQYVTSNIDDGYFENCKFKK